MGGWPLDPEPAQLWPHRPQGPSELLLLGGRDWVRPWLGTWVERGGAKGVPTWQASRPPSSYPAHTMFLVMDCSQRRHRIQSTRPT